MHKNGIKVKEVLSLRKKLLEQMLLQEEEQKTKGKYRESNT